jgi:hypothetical protein
MESSSRVSREESDKEEANHCRRCSLVRRLFKPPVQTRTSAQWRREIWKEAQLYNLLHAQRAQAYRRQKRAEEIARREKW